MTNDLLNLKRCQTPQFSWKMQQKGPNLTKKDFCNRIFTNKRGGIDDGKKH